MSGESGLSNVPICVLDVDDFYEGNTSVFGSFASFAVMILSNRRDSFDKIIFDGPSRTACLPVQPQIHD